MFETQMTTENTHTTEEKDNNKMYASATTTSNMTPISSYITTNATRQDVAEPPQLSEGRKNLWKWLGKTFRVKITDGRVLVGFFCCTDKDANVVLSMCAEYLEEETKNKDARILGNVMIPGKHIVSISVDMPQEDAVASEEKKPVAEPI